jgi:hypothetical protein
MKLNSPTYFIFIWTCFFSGCKSVRENLDKQYDRVEKIYSETYNQSENKEVEELGWEDAQAMLLENNLDV